MFIQKFNDTFTTPIPFLDKKVERPKIREAFTQVLAINVLSTWVVATLLYLFTDQSSWILIAGLMTITHVPALLLVYYQKLNLALLTVPIGLFTVITAVIIIHPDLLAIMAGFYGLIILSAGILLGSRMAIITAVVSAVTYIAMLLLLPLEESYPAPSITILSFLFVTQLAGFTIIAHFSIRTVFWAYLKALESNTELEAIRQKLEAHSAELLEANEALRNNEATKQAIIDSIPDMMAVISKEGIYLEYKAPFYFRYEDPPEKVIGHTIDELLPPHLAEERWRHIQHVLSTGERVEYEETQPVRGNPHIFSTRIMAIDSEKALIIMRDITESKQQEASNLADQKRESVGLLAGGVAHDFNNLLTGMMAQTSLALKKIPPDNGAVKNIRKANIAAERAADLTRQLLAYTGQGGFKIETVNLNDIIRENVTLIQATLPPNIALKLDLHPELSSIEADPSQIQQITMNLVINAVEAINDSKGEVHIRTFLASKSAIVPTRYDIDNFQPEAEQFVCLQVQDNGMGIKREILDRIFDPFFSTKSGSRGLGLAASLGIIRRYHGGIQVDAPADGGSCFNVYLPSKTDISEIKRSEDKIHELLDLNIPKLSGKKILIIDDEVSVREAIRDIFELVGIEFLVAEDGYRGFEVYQTYQDTIGLIILDMKMPGQSGMETLQHIHQLNADVPVLVSSGYTEEKAAAYFADKATHFLPKPFKAHSLLKAIQNALEA